MAQQQGRQEQQGGQQRGNQHWMDEADIGSGEKSAAQRELESEQQALGAQRRDQHAADGDAGEAAQLDDERQHTLQDGDHLARVATRQLDDGSWEAQVYVRLTREPQRAETYIPVGTFPTEEAARAAAKERAQRALREQEF